MSSASCGVMHYCRLPLMRLLSRINVVIAIWVVRCVHPVEAGSGRCVINRCKLLLCVGRGVLTRSSISRADRLLLPIRPPRRAYLCRVYRTRPSVSRHRDIAAVLRISILFRSSSRPSTWKTMLIRPLGATPCQGDCGVLHSARTTAATCQEMRGTSGGRRLATLSTPRHPPFRLRAPPKCLCHSSLRHPMWRRRRRPNCQACRPACHPKRL